MHLPIAYSLNTMTSAKATPQSSVEELEKVVEATLAQYHLSFDVPSSGDNNKSKECALISHAYYSRLESFRTEMYFAKPLCLSPLNCAAFG